MNGSRGLRFTLFGFPVQVDIMFLIIVAILGSGAGDAAKVVIWVAVVFVSVLAHELGHAFMGRSFGLSAAIRLYGMGGMTHWLNERDTTPSQDILISLSGPCTGLAIGAAVFGLRTVLPPPQGELMREFVWILLWVNIGWAILNLLPIIPLDGGHVMRSVLHIVLGHPNETIPRVISVVFAVSALGLALLVEMYWAAMLAGMFAVMNIAALAGSREP